MVLAARCPECNTAFRIVPDQLKISEGWVRCGHCSYVFNAEQTQFEISEAALEQTLLEQKKQSPPSENANTPPFEAPPIEPALPNNSHIEIEIKKFRDAIKNSTKTEEENDYKEQDSFSFSEQHPEIENESSQQIELSEDSQLDIDDISHHSNDFGLDHTELDTIDVSLEEPLAQPLVDEDANFADTHLSEFQIGWQDSVPLPSMQSRVNSKIRDIINFRDSMIVAEEIAPGDPSWNANLHDSDAFNSSWENNKISSVTGDNLATQAQALDVSEFFASFKNSKPAFEDTSWAPSISMNPQDEELEVNTTIEFMPTAFEKQSHEAPPGYDEVSTPDKALSLSILDASAMSLMPNTGKSQSNESPALKSPPYKNSPSVDELKKAGAIILPVQRKEYRRFENNFSFSTENAYPSEFLSSITLDDQEASSDSTFGNPGAVSSVFLASPHQTGNDSAEPISTLPFEHSYFQPSQIGSYAETTTTTQAQKVNEFKNAPSTKQEEKDFVTTVLDDGYLDSQNRPYKKKKQSPKTSFETVKSSSYQEKRKEKSHHPSTVTNTITEERHRSRIALNEEEEFPEVSFVQANKVSALWQNPVIKLGQILAFIVLSVLFFLQLGFFAKNSLAEKIPSLRPVLTAFCKPFGCSVDYPRKPNDVKIYDSALRRTNDTDPDLYTLMLLLKNKANQDVALPVVELILTDHTTEEVYSRKVFSLHDLGVETRYLKTNEEIYITSHLLIKTNNNMPLGFTVDLFYP